MISWIQKYFQHHFRLVFGIMLVIIVVPLVWVFNTSSGTGGQGSRGIAPRPFFNYNLSLPEDSAKVYGDAQLSLQLKLGPMMAYSGLDADTMNQYALTRTTSLHLANEWHIPAATAAEITEAIKKLRMFAGPDGQFDAKSYATYRDTLKTNPRGLTEGDIARVIGDDVRVDHVNKLLGGPGYVVPGDIKNQLADSDTTWSLGTATVDYAAFKVDVKPTDADLTKFFEENSFRYEIPPRVVATLVEFPSAAHAASVTPSEAEIRAFYDENPTRFPKPVAVKPADGKTPEPAKVDPAADYAAVRPQVEATLKLQRAQQLAVKAASDFAVALHAAFEGKQPSEPDLQSFLAGRKLTQKPVPAFTASDMPVELGGNPNAVQEAFKLNARRFASDAFPIPVGGGVLLWKDTQAPRKPLFAEVKDKVSTDYIDNEKTKRFIELGKSIKSQLEARLKAGDAFDKAVATVATATSTTIEAKTIPPFTLRTRPQDLDYAINSTLERLEKGQVSDMLRSSAEKALFVYALDKKAPDLSDANPRYVETRDQLSAMVARSSASAVVIELTQNEDKKSAPKTP
jgi:peptidyl-prolyl cis-trans isomerase D